MDKNQLSKVIQAAIKTAKEYRELIDKPLGITGEVGEFLVADLLGLELAEARTPRYDAVAPDGRKVQIKARCVLPDSKQGQRVGSIKLDHDWDTVALILMDENFDPKEIWEASRKDIEKEIKRPGSKARNVRGALGVNKFRIIGKQIWPA